MFFPSKVNFRVLLSSLVDTASCKCSLLHREDSQIEFVQKRTAQRKGNTAHTAYNYQLKSSRGFQTHSRAAVAEKQIVHAAVASKTIGIN